MTDSLKNNINMKTLSVLTFLFSGVETGCIRSQIVFSIETANFDLFVVSVKGRNNYVRYNMSRESGRGFIPFAKDECSFQRGTSNFTSIGLGVGPLEGVNVWSSRVDFGDPREGSAFRY